MLLLILQYLSIICFLVAFTLDTQTKGKKNSKKQFQKQIISDETLRIHTKKQTLDNDRFCFNLFLRIVSGETIVQYTTSGSLLILALLLVFLHTNLWL